MALCTLNLGKVDPQEKKLLDSMFFHPIDKYKDDDGNITLRYGSGSECKGINDFDEQCLSCRYIPPFVRKIVERKNIVHHLLS